MAEIHPYVEGGELTLTVHATTGKHTAVKARIVKVFTPFTLSSVMVVRLSLPCPCPDLGIDINRQKDLQKEVVLKVYDRRVVPSYRKVWGVENWTPEVERQYEEFLSSGQVSEFIPKLEDDNEDSDAWTTAQNEYWINYKMQSFYEAEKKVYQMASHLQGHDIPHFLLHGRLTNLPSSSSSDPSTTTVPPELQFPWILLQFIPGFSLEDTAKHAPKEHWQSIGEDALQIIHSLGNLGIVNEDARLWNFIVSSDELANDDDATATATKFKVFMIDFAMVTFREEVDSQLEWRKLKALQDEEGVVGRPLQKYLAPHFVYHRSEEYKQLSAEFRSEECED